MEALRELLASDHKLTFEFFQRGLEELADPTVDRQELLYNASVLAHYAQVSTHAVGDLPAPTSLAQVFDGFVLDSSHAADGEMMEAAGAQCLLLAGFFEDQMRRRHAIRWYAKMGAGFYQRASVHQQSARKARLLCAIAKRFEIWRQLHAQLSRSLRDLPYLMAPPPPPAVS
jgi:hypothetical protein